MRHIARRRARGVDIPVASTGDIAFLLIIFFILVTLLGAEWGVRRLRGFV